MHDPLSSHDNPLHVSSSGEAIHSSLGSQHELGFIDLGSGLNSSSDPSGSHHLDPSYNPAADPFNAHYTPAIDLYVTTDQALHQLTTDDPQFGHLLGQVNQITSGNQEFLNQLHQVQSDLQDHAVVHASTGQTPAHYPSPSPDSSLDSFASHLNNQVNETLSPHIPTQTELNELHRQANAQAALTEQSRIDTSSYTDVEASFNTTNMLQDNATAQNDASSTADDAAWASWYAANEINNAWLEN